MRKHNYREDLQNRTIMPSSDSWEKLDKKLTDANSEKKRHWKILKVASVLLVFLSISWYFYDRPDNTINSRIIATPSPKEDLNSIQDLNRSSQTKIADKSKDKPVDTSPSVDLSDNVKEASTYSIAKADTAPVEETINLVNTESQLIENDMKSEEIMLAEIDTYSDSLMDREIEQLLQKSKIKLIVNGQISSKKLVNADALLNSVEDDMNKSLKEKLLDKIVLTLKKEREVASSKEN